MDVLKCSVSDTEFHREGGYMECTQLGAALASGTSFLHRVWRGGKSFWLKGVAVVGLLGVVVLLTGCARGGGTHHSDVAEDTQPDVTLEDTQPTVTATEVQPDPTADDAQPDPTADDTQPDPSEYISPDHATMVAVNGPPQAFTVYFDPISDSVLEEWTYFTIGQEVVFSDGSYEGGVEVPLPEIDESAAIPWPAAFPWQILQDPTPEQMVSLAGPALFRTSAFVLPGWNDDYQVARLWVLAGGGNMITVDGELAMVSIDPGQAVDEDLLEVSNLFVGTLGEGDDRLGAILSPGDGPGTYRLSLSPRGQGTTEDGTEVVFDLEEAGPDGSSGGRTRVVALDGSEEVPDARGTVNVKAEGDGYEVSVDVRVDGREIVVSGRMRSGLWTATDDDAAGG
jgi:hypothetical protein